MTRVKCNSRRCLNLGIWSKGRSNAYWSYRLAATAHGGLGLLQCSTTRRSTTQHDTPFNRTLIGAGNKWLAIKIKEFNLKKKRKESLRWAQCAQTLRSNNCSISFNRFKSIACLVLGLYWQGHWWTGNFWDTLRHHSDAPLMAWFGL